MFNALLEIEYGCNHAHTVRVKSNEIVGYGSGAIKTVETQSATISNWPQCVSPVNIRYIEKASIAGHIILVTLCGLDC